MQSNLDHGSMKHSTAISPREPGNTAHSDRRDRTAFTLIEVLTVISIIGVLAAIGAGLSGVANRKMKEATITAQRDQFVTAIESYKADLNQYPPDNAVNGHNANPVIHPLYYELVGTISSNRGALYQTSDRQETIASTTIRQAFNQDGFVNSVEPGQRPKSYIRDLKSSQLATFDLGSAAPSIDLLVIPARWPRKYAALAPLTGRLPNTATVDKRMTIPWCYVSTSPTNNPTGFDLWATWNVQFRTRKDGTTETNFLTIGNWKH